MAHHHNIAQVIKTPMGYLAYKDGVRIFIDDPMKAHNFGYWTFAFDNTNRGRLLEILEEWAVPGNLISFCTQEYIKLYEIDE